jgi:hypothetical protein
MSYTAMHAGGLLHVTRHTSHVSRHTSHVTRHTLPSFCSFVYRFLKIVRSQMKIDLEVRLRHVPIMLILPSAFRTNFADFCR